MRELARSPEDPTHGGILGFCQLLELSELGDEQLEQVFRRDLSRFRAWLADQSHIDVLEVDYNRMVAAPEAELNGVSQFLGGDLDVPAMCRVVEPDLYRNRS